MDKSRVKLENLRYLVKELRDNYPQAHLMERDVDESDEAILEKNCIISNMIAEEMSCSKCHLSFFPEPDNPLCCRMSFAYTK